MTMTTNDDSDGDDACYRAREHTLTQNENAFCITLCESERTMYDERAARNLI